MARIRCWNCNYEYPERYGVCPNCGKSESERGGTGGASVPNSLVYNSGYDHTLDFSQQEASRDRPFALLAYLIGLPGIMIASIGQKSDYVKFHVRQALKYTLLNYLIVLAALALTIIIGFIASLGASGYEVQMAAREFGIFARLLYGFYKNSDFFSGIMVITVVLIVAVRILSFISAVITMMGRSVEGLLVRYMSIFGNEGDLSSGDRYGRNRVVYKR